MSDLSLTTEEKRFTNFTKELANLSKKYGIVLDVVGGVYFVDLETDKESIANLAYTDDSTSGDMSPINFFDE